MWNRKKEPRGMKEKTKTDRRTMLPVFIIAYNKCPQIGRHTHTKRNAVAVTTALSARVLLA